MIKLEHVRVENVMSYIVHFDFPKIYPLDVCALI